MNKALKILAIFILTMVSLPAIVNLTKLKTINPLKGAYEETRWMKFSYTNCKSSAFQSNFEKFVEDRIGLRPQIVRLANQMNYLLFKELNPKGLILGKENYLYELDYYNTQKGLDYLGYNTIKETVKHLKTLQDSLHAYGTKLLVLLAPDKVTFYPEYLPDNYDTNGFVDSSNYKVYSQLLLHDSIAYINYNPLFKQWKDTASYPLFSKYGTHWSSYGCVFAADTMRAALEHISGTKLNRYKINNIETTHTARNTDYDIGEFLNLMFPLPGPELAYPKLSFNNLNKKPRVLIIGDSFYVNICESDIPEHVFSIHDFLFYNKRLYGNESKHVNLANDFKNYDFVILETTTLNVKLLRNGFFKN